MHLWKPHYNGDATIFIEISLIIQVTNRGSTQARLQRVLHLATKVVNDIIEHRSSSTTCRRRRQLNKHSKLTKSKMLQKVGHDDDKPGELASGRKADSFFSDSPCTLALPFVGVWV
jgi:hypothetical protein